MASTLQDKLLEIFTAIAGDQTRFPERGTGTPAATVQDSSTNAVEAGPAQVGGLGQLQSAANADRAVIQPTNTVAATVPQSVMGDVGNALLTNSLSLSGLLAPTGGVVDAAKDAATDGGVAQTLESVVAKVFTSGFGLVSLFSGLFGLFGGGDQQEPPPLVKYALPPRIDFQAAETANGIVNVDYDQSGLPRPAGAASQGSSTSAGTAITVNVQALDARSFLDRSNEIAAAVRDAMLNLNSINDVVNEL